MSDCTECACIARKIEDLIDLWNYRRYYFDDNVWLDKLSVHITELYDLTRP